ncbi:hypothetical protein AB0H94_35000 [Streptomyces purpurascens]|uniref:hypothetical protein n=1 Tax=Streptomyces purpurascens TaxID=1924 RepID=UPI0033D00BB6
MTSGLWELVLKGVWTTVQLLFCFPAVHERVQQAAAAMPPGTPAQPFIDALTELVQAQAGTTGFVVLHRWGCRHHENLLARGVETAASERLIEVFAVCTDGRTRKAVLVAAGSAGDADLDEN